eukprot:m51a1_g7250 hypothetical protein (241) ;mRNA; f:139709-140715
MVRVRALYAGRTWSLLVLSSIRKREGDVEDDRQLAAKEARSKKFRSNWIEDQAAKGNAYLWTLDRSHRLLAIDEEAVARDLDCTSLSMMKTISRRFHSFSLSKRETFPTAFDLLEKDGFVLEKPKVVYGSHKSDPSHPPATPSAVRDRVISSPAGVQATAAPAQPPAIPESPALTTSDPAPRHEAAAAEGETSEGLRVFDEGEQLQGGPQESFFGVDNATLEQDFATLQSFAGLDEALAL